MAASDSKSGGALLREESQGSDDEGEMTMQQELTMLGGSENLGGTFADNNEMFGGRGMSGEEYFETHPNDQSYEIDNTNRDLVTQGNVPIEMMSPDVSMMHDEIRPKGKRSNAGSFISIKSTHTTGAQDTEAGTAPEDYEHL